MPLETVSDLSTFFAIDGGPAIRALIIDLRSNPPPYARTLAVVFDDGTKSVDAYGDTEVEAPAPSFECPKPDRDGVTRGMTVRFLGLLPGEEGYGKTYQVGRIAGEDIGTSRVFLKEL
jgi:hypothetical protein